MTIDIGRIPAALALTLSVLLTVAIPSVGLSAQELTLREAIESALATHPTVHGVRAREVQAREAISANRGSLWPTLAVDLSLNQFQEPMLAQPLHDFDPTRVPTFDETLLQGRLGAQYTLLGGGRSSRIESSEANLEAVRAQARVVEDDVMEAVAQAYLSVLSSRAMSAAVEATVTSLTEEVARAQDNFDAGTAPAVNVLRADVALKDALAHQTDADAAVELSERRLARWIGEPVEAIRGASIANVRLGPTDFSSATGINPRVESAERRAEAVRAQLSERRSARHPKLNLNAGVVDYSSGSGSHALEWQAGVALSWAIFSGGTRRASVRGAEAEVAAAESEISSTRLVVEQETDMARTTIETAEARAIALAASVEQWEELTRIEALAIEAGTGVQSDLLRAEAGLFQARAGHTQAYYEAVLARVRLAKAQGILNRSWIAEVLEGSE